MKMSEEIQQELEGICPLLACVPRCQLYDLPPDYFVKFQQEIGQHVVMEKEIAVLKNKEKPQLYNIPDGYFAHFLQNLASKIKAQELEQAAPTLATLPKRALYEVPGHYFTELPQKLLQKINAQASNKKEYWWTKCNTALNDWMEQLQVVLLQPRYALATACLVGIVMSAISFLNNSAAENTSLKAQLQQISEQNVLAYMTTHSEEFDENTFIESHAIDTFQPTIENSEGMDATLQNFLVTESYIEDLIEIL